MDALKAKIPWEFHFKALIQAKGFLKIIEFVSSFLVAVATCDCVADCALECLCSVAGRALKSGMVRLCMTCASGTRGVLQCAARDMRVESSGTCNSCQTRITQTFPPHPSLSPPPPPSPPAFLPSSQFLAIITFSILASYTAETGVGLCTRFNSTNANTSLVLSSHYPFDKFNFMRTIEGGEGPQPVSKSIGSPIPGISRQAMLFVAWGVITLFYCIVAVGVYVATMAKADDLGKIYIALVYTVSGRWGSWCQGHVAGVLSPVWFVHLAVVGTHFQHHQQKSNLGASLPPPLLPRTLASPSSGASCGWWCQPSGPQASTDC